MKKIILITMLISAIFAQSDCNESNWQEYFNSQGRDMSDCQLQGAMLRGARLMGADLTGADLTGANITQARLMGADLTGADLTGANITQARLMGADLTGADLTGANFTQARLMGADLIGANFTGANFTGAKLVGVISGDIRGVPDNLPEGWSLVDGTVEIIKEAVLIADEIKKFKELLDAGAITQEEYDAEKKKLLGL